MPVKVVKTEHATKCAIYNAYRADFSEIVSDFSEIISEKLTFY